MPKASMLRIIGGQWRRHQLPIAPVEGLRPTPDRVRETLFNWLGQTCEGLSVLDLYSGTGALGLEAASRGAEHVTLVESQPAVIRQLKANVLALSSKTVPSSSIQVKGLAVEAALKSLPTYAFDVIFLDPPFGSGALPVVLPRLRPLLKDGGLIYIEWGENLFDDQEQLAKWLKVGQIDALRYLKAGQVHAHLVALPSL